MWGEAGKGLHLNPLPKGEEGAKRLMRVLRLNEANRTGLFNIERPTPSSEARISNQKIDPIKNEKRDGGAANKFSLARGQLRDSHARRPRDDHSQCIKIKDR